jgi:hypothetical protein
LEVHTLRLSLVNNIILQFNYLVIHQRGTLESRYCTESEKA